MPPPEEGDLPGTPWDIQANQLMRLQNATEQVARDYVILEWLFKGNTSPFTAFVLQGHIPCMKIIKYVALMMNPANGTEKIVPFALAISSRGRKGRRPNPVIKVRGQLTAQNVELRMKEGKTFNKAISEVAELLGEDLDSDIPYDTVEKDYKRYKSKS